MTEFQEDGYARVVGRIKDVIIRLADKIVPSEVEEFFETHLNIIEAQVQSLQQLCLLMYW